MPFGLQINETYQCEVDPLHKPVNTTKESSSDDFSKIPSTESLQDHESGTLEVEYDFVCSTTENYRDKCITDVRSSFTEGDMINTFHNLVELAWVYCLIFGITTAEPIEVIQEDIQRENEELDAKDEAEANANREDEVVPEDDSEPAVAVEAVPQEVEYEMDAQDQYENFDLNNKSLGIVAIVEEKQEGFLVKSTDGTVHPVGFESLEVVYNVAELLNNANTNGLTDVEFEFIWNLNAEDEDVQFAVYDKTFDTVEEVPFVVSGEKLVLVHAVSQDQDLNLVQHGTEFFAVPAEDLMPIAHEEVYPMLNEEGKLTPDEIEMLYNADGRAHFAVLYYTSKTWDLKPTAGTCWVHIASEEDEVEEYSDSEDVTSVGSGQVSEVDGMMKFVAKPVTSRAGWEKLEGRDGTQKWFSKSTIPPPFNMDDEDIYDMGLHSDDTAFILEDTRKIYLLDIMTWQDGEGWLIEDGAKLGFMKEIPAQQPTYVDL